MHRDVRSAGQFALLTSLYVLVPHLMSFPSASAQNAPRWVLLHLTSHFHFPFFHLSSLLPLPFKKVMQPFLPFLFFFFFFSSFPCTLLNVGKNLTHMKGRAGGCAGCPMLPRAQVLMRTGQLATL